MPEAPIVFISYSHDSDEHKAWVRGLAEDLAKGGVFVHLDQWDLRHGEDVIKFMEDGISSSDRTLCVCTENYVAKADARSGGVGYEGTVITGEMADRLGTSKFVPVIRQPSGSALRPIFLKTRMYIDFSDATARDARMVELLRAIHDAPSHPRPELGTNPFAEGGDGGVTDATSSTEVQSGSAGGGPDPAEYLDYGLSRFNAISSEREVSMPPHGSLEIACLLDPSPDGHSTNEAFRRLLSATNPQYTGWPLWVDTGSATSEARLYVFDEGWEALGVSIGRLFMDTLDFWRAEPQGKFYHRRAFEDDLTDSPNAPEALTGLDLVLTTKRVTEGVGVVRAFAEGMGCDLSNTSLEFAFRWSGLRDREATSWADIRRHMTRQHRAVQDSVTTTLSVPADSQDGDFPMIVHQAVGPLFTVFDGLEIADDVLTGVVEEVLVRGR